MCGRFCCSLCPAELQDKLEKDGLPVKGDWIDQEKFHERYNVAPRSFVPVIRQDGKDGHPINARDDTLIGGSPMFDQAKLTQRCIVVADGFFEWKKLGGGKKVPYYTRRKDGRLMLFAGLYAKAHPSDWNEPVLYSTTIVTTSPSPFFAFLHDRMPVILDSKEALIWLDGSQSWKSGIAPLIRPYQGQLDW
ncbi:DUF159-domain-containing protein [Hesseltinella vesiculosa]|uniref:DUF159-domain-containing protein n=1 Tax=Hesseltinella vesiculosa TaxID=101127 RepID=A0A1X2GVD2_9FUNG|nr:DUF159-domain-containing protein [Hesseltinella vesiculosa]